MGEAVHLSRYSTQKIWRGVSSKGGGTLPTYFLKKCKKRCGVAHPTSSHVNARHCTSTHFLSLFILKRVFLFFFFLRFSKNIPPLRGHPKNSFLITSTGSRRRSMHILLEIRPVVLPSNPGQTDRQTDKQTNKQASYIYTVN